VNDATPAGAQQPSDSQPANQLITEVLVVGASSTGRMLANWLARVGVGVIAIDGTAGPTNESRALVVQAQSMEIDDQLGIAEQVLAQTVPARSRAPGFGTRVFGSIPIGVIGAGTTGSARNGECRCTASPRPQRHGFVPASSTSCAPTA